MSTPQNPLELVFHKVLEDWAMMLIDPAEKSTALFCVDQPLFLSHVEMHGAFHGTLSIVAQKQFMQTLSANLLGGPPDTSVNLEELMDGFREMANVMAGNFITEAYGDDVAFDMLNPKVEEMPFAELEKLLQNPQTICVLADDAPVSVSFCVKS